MNSIIENIENLGNLIVEKRLLYKISIIENIENLGNLIVERRLLYKISIIENVEKYYFIGE